MANKPPWQTEPAIKNATETKKACFPVALSRPTVVSEVRPAADQGVSEPKPDDRYGHRHFRPELRSNHIQMLADRGAAIATFEPRKGSVERSNEVPQVFLRMSRHSTKCVHTSRCISDQNSTRKLLCALVSSLSTKCVHTYFLRE